MGDQHGFLTVPRDPAPKRPIHERIEDYKQVYLPLTPTHVRSQASRCMDCGVPFCNSGCPVGNLIPDWNDLVYRDDWYAAFRRLDLTNNFPEFTGQLCPAPCEASCVLSINDDPVTIKDVELAIVNRAFDEGWIVPQPPRQRTGKQVAIVGSGPAGLAAAQQLNRLGHHVLVFERDDRIGGLLRYGIPDFKIEKWVVDRRIDQLRAEGIEFAPNAQVGVNPTVAGLRREFDAILLAVGALQGRELPAAGNNLDGVHLAMDYLVQQNRRVAGDTIGTPPITAARKRVTIIGGGDTSADCLGNANREGAESVLVLTHGPEPPKQANPLEWPEWPFVLHTYPAHEEGAERQWKVVVTGLTGNGHIEAIKVADARRVNGQHEAVPGTERRLPTDLVLVAIGFSGPVRDKLFEDLPIEFGDDGAILTDDRYRTSVSDVYAAGDARRGAALIVWAIAEGRRVATQIDRDLVRLA